MISAFVAVMSAVGETLTPIVRTLSPPTKYFCTAPSGTITWSSGSWNPEPPLGCRMPITWNGIPPIEISVPRSPASEPEGVGRGRAEDGDAQLAVDADLGQERALPHVVGADRGVVGGGADDGRGRRFAARHAPRGWWRPRARRPRPSRARRSRRRLRGVSVVEPSAFWVVGLIVRRFVPRLASRSVMFVVVPWPTPTRATTDATPMITPSIVSAARSRLVRRRDRARRSSSTALMPRSARRAGGSGGRRRRRPPGRG